MSSPLVVPIDMEEADTVISHPGDVLKGRTQIVYDVKGGAVAV